MWHFKPGLDLTLKDYGTDPVRGIFWMWSNANMRIAGA
jgi:hypothetical protein